MPFAVSFVIIHSCLSEAFRIHRHSKRHIQWCLCQGKQRDNTAADRLMEKKLNGRKQAPTDDFFQSFSMRFQTTCRPQVAVWYVWYGMVWCYSTTGRVELGFIRKTMMGRQGSGFNAATESSDLTSNLETTSRRDNRYHNMVRVGWYGTILSVIPVRSA